jgi:putative FmdB family regulatory protein
MPTYEWRCKDCSETFEKTLRLSEYRELGGELPCPHCESQNTGQIFTTCNFNLKGDDWPGKSIRINNQMRERQERLKPRQDAKRREEPGVRLAPNVGGERVGSWKDAQRLAASQGKDTASYEPMIRKEKSQ